MLNSWFLNLLIYSKTVIVERWYSLEGISKVESLYFKRNPTSDSLVYKPLRSRMANISKEKTDHKMMQKYTCVPICDYEVLIVTNGTVSQVEGKLTKLNEQNNDEIPLNSSITYLKTFKELVEYLSFYKDSNNDEVKYTGKIVFMFFNGLEFVQDILCDAIDHSHKCTATRDIPFDYHMRSMIDKAHDYNDKSQSVEVMQNTYFYYDSTVMSDDADFNMVVSIVKDILKKTDFMVGRIRGVYIDDEHLEGEKAFAVSNLLRNYPNIETLQLTSRKTIMMKDLIV